MIDPIKEQVIREMAKQGIAKRMIAKQLKIARNTVDRVLETEAGRPSVSKESRYDQHIDQIREIFRDCQGNVVRINDPNRKARIERPFDYVERNFLAGRTFTDWQDLNLQARQWCDQVANRKPKTSLGMSPMEAWVMEKPSLHPLPKVLPPVYLAEQRTVDIEGYVHLDTNRYSVPDTLIGKNVEVLKYWQRVVIYWGRNIVAEHDRELLAREKRITTPGHHQPLNRKKAHQGISIEEHTLIGQHESLDRYVAAIKKQARGRGIVKLRRLLDLKRTYPPASFQKAVVEALRYGLYDLHRLEKMILKNTGGDFFEIS